MKRIVLIIFSFLVVFTSCDPVKKMERAKKRISRIIYRNPGIVLKDTIKMVDTLTIPDIHTDTLFKDKIGDTITVIKDRMTIKYYKGGNDTVFLDGKCKGDTVIKEKIIYRDKVEVPKSLTRSERIKIWLFDNWWWIVGILVIIFFIIKAYLKTIKPV